MLLGEFSPVAVSVEDVGLDKVVGLVDGVLDFVDLVDDFEVFTEFDVALLLQPDQSPLLDNPE